MLRLLLWADLWLVESSNTFEKSTEGIFHVSQVYRFLLLCHSSGSGIAGCSDLNTADLTLPLVITK